MNHCLVAASRCISETYGDTLQADASAIEANLLIRTHVAAQSSGTSGKTAPRHKSSRGSRAPR